MHLPVACLCVPIPSLQLVDLPGNPRPQSISWPALQPKHLVQREIQSTAHHFQPASNDRYREEAFEDLLYKFRLIPNLNSSVIARRGNLFARRIFNALTATFNERTAMSEPPPSATKTEDTADFSTNLNEDGDATQPTAEILNALDQLNSDTTPNSQESIKLEQQPPKEEELQQPHLSEWESLRNRLRDNPHDPEGWSKLVELAENSGEIEEIKETYESLFEIYPNTVCQLPASASCLISDTLFDIKSSAQIAYLNHFMIPGSFGTAEAIFKKILRSSPSVDLWKFYLTYVR